MKPTLRPLAWIGGLTLLTTLGVAGITTGIMWGGWSAVSQQLVVTTTDSHLVGLQSPAGPVEYWLPLATWPEQTPRPDLVFGQLVAPAPANWRRPYTGVLLRAPSGHRVPIQTWRAGTVQALDATISWATNCSDGITIHHSEPHLYTTYCGLHPLPDLQPGQLLQAGDSLGYLEAPAVALMTIRFRGLAVDPALFFDWSQASPQPPGGIS